MTKTIRIGESASLIDLKDWLGGEDPAQEGTRFQVSRDSGFAPGVEGVALGVLAEIALRGPLAIESTLDGVEDLKLFGSLFGISLGLLSSKVCMPSGPSDGEALANALWKGAVEKGGIVGTGNRIGIVFRDPDYWLPRCFANDGGTFPKRDTFRRSLERVVSRLGLQRSFSNTEEDALTFLYETAQNSHEHGRFGPDGRAVAGVRGILLERISINSSAELEKRRDVQEFQRTYLRNQIRTRGTPLVFFSYTVADLGSGIQNTLPPLAEAADETSWQRLNRAFAAGSTRKQQSAGLDAGQGLSKLHSSAERLHALLFVKSSRLSGYIDFSDASSGKSFQEISASQNAVGTVLTLMWPSVPAGGDQGTLPLDPP